MRRRKARGGAIIARNQAYLAKLSVSARTEMTKVNDTSASDFEGLVKRIIPVGDPADGNLVNTVEKKPSSRYETGFQVSIGSPAQPYPFHLEVGYRAEDGSHVEGKHYWFPARRTVQRKHRKASRAALKAAVEELKGG